MVKISGLSSQQLKEKLQSLGLSTEGLKSELASRLQIAIEKDAGDRRSRKSSPTPGTSGRTSVDEGDEDEMENTEAMDQPGTTILVQPPTPAEQQKSPLDMDDLMKALLLEMKGIGAKFDQQDLKLDQIKEVQELQSQVLQREVKNLKKDVDGRFKELEDKIKQVEARSEICTSHTSRDGYTNQTFSTEPVSRSSRGILKPPTFDGEIPFDNFKVQFEAAVNYNGWTTEEQLNALILALRGNAADVLQTVTAKERSYERVMIELELRYGQSHVKELCKIQLQSKRQLRGESLQDLERVVMKLARQAYGNAPADMLNELSVDAFINAVKDDHLKLHLRTNTRGKSINEVLALALEYEAARASLATDTAKLRKLDSEDITQIKTLIKEELSKPRQSFRGNGRKKTRSPSRCFRCQRPGHYIRECKQPSTERLRGPDVQAKEEIRQLDVERDEERKHLSHLNMDPEN